MAPVDMVMSNDDAPLAVRTSIAVSVNPRQTGTGRAGVVTSLQNDVIVAGADVVKGKDDILQVTIERDRAGRRRCAAGCELRRYRPGCGPRVECVGVLDVVAVEGCAGVERVAVTGRVCERSKGRRLQLDAPNGEAVDSARHHVEVGAVVQEYAVQR